MRRPTTVINLLVTALIVAGILTASILTLRAAPRVRKVEAFVGCPAPIQVAVPLALSGLSQFYSRFESVSYKAESDAVAMDDLRNGSVDVAVVTMPPSVSDLAGMYEWQLAVPVSTSEPWSRQYPLAATETQGLYAVTRDNAHVGRNDNSNQVMADNWINWVRTGFISTPLTAYGYTPAPATTRQPIPDADVNLDGTVSLGDIGAIVQNWGLVTGLPPSPGCPGWIRADAAHQGKVSLASIGVVAQHWGNDGLICDAEHDNCNNPGNGWWMVPGVTGGTYYDWGDDAGSPSYQSPNQSDHHDSGVEHAVDIDIPAGTPVYYLDPRGAVTTSTHYAPLGGCTSGEGGALLDVLLSADGLLRATEAFHHLTDVPVPLQNDGAVVANGDTVGNVFPLPSPTPACYTGTHVHLGVFTNDPQTVLTHYTGPAKSWYCVAPTPPAPTSDGDSDSGWPVQPCYGVSWPAP